MPSGSKPRRNHQPGDDPRARTVPKEHCTWDAFDALPIEVKRVLWGACTNLVVLPGRNNSVAALKRREKARRRRIALAAYGPDHPEA